MRFLFCFLFSVIFYSIFDFVLGFFLFKVFKLRLGHQLLCMAFAPFSTKKSRKWLYDLCPVKDCSNCRNWTCEGFCKK